ncbi:hypothetical protein PALB_21820 [Pseudoalteromonas luteoviolacea B = ATCC 29581]|nr:hypothetical protein PALB_21820 [Pseudoalteromonas luteoviolacea B = ATCC 29581]
MTSIFKFVVICIVVIALNYITNFVLPNATPLVWLLPSSGLFIFLLMTKRTAFAALLVVAELAWQISLFHGFTLDPTHYALLCLSAFSAISGYFICARFYNEHLFRRSIEDTIDPVRLLVILSLTVVIFLISAKIESLVIQSIRSDIPESYTLVYFFAKLLGLFLFLPLAYFSHALFINSDKQARISLSAYLLLTAGFLAINSYFTYSHINLTKERFIKATQDHTANLNIDFVAHLKKVESLGRFYASSEFVNRDEFESFVQSQEHQYSIYKGFSWNQLVENDKIDAYLAQLSTEFNRDIALQKITITPPHNYSVIVSKIYPYNEWQHLIGLDVTTEATRYKAIRRAIETGKMVISDLITLQQFEDDNEVGALAFYPVYHSENSRIKHFPDGFAVGVLNLSRFFSSVSTVNSGFDLEYSITEFGNSEPFFNSANSTSFNSGEFENTNELKVANKHYIIQYYNSGHHFLEDAPQELFSAYVLSSIIVILCIYALLRSNHHLFQIGNEVQSKRHLLDFTNHIQSLIHSPLEREHFEQAICSLAAFFNSQETLVVFKEVNPSESSNIEVYVPSDPEKCMSEQASKAILKHYGAISFEHSDIREHLLENSEYIIEVPWSRDNKFYNLVFKRAAHYSSIEKSQANLILSILNNSSTFLEEQSKLATYSASLKEKVELLKNTEEVGDIGTWKIDHVQGNTQISLQVFRLLNLPSGDPKFALSFYFNQLSISEKKALVKLLKTVMKKEESKTLIHKIMVNAQEHFFMLRFDNRCNGWKVHTTLGVIYDITQEQRSKLELEEHAEQERLTKKSLTELTFNVLNNDSSLEAQMNEIAYSGNKTLNVDRSSIWLLDQEQNQLVCKAFVENQQVANPLEHRIELTSCPSYTQALHENPFIAIEDTSSEDNCLSELQNDYLIPLNIKALLDVPITKDGQVIGVVCMEVKQRTRKWNSEDALYVNALGALIARAISEHERTELLSELYLQQYEREEILANMIDGVITINQRGLIKSINPSVTKIFGYKKSELIGKNISIIMNDKDAKHHDEYIHNYTQTHSARVIGVGREVIGRRKDGSAIVLRLSVAELSLSNQDEKTFVGVLHDLTFEKEQQQQLQRAEKMDALGQLTGGIAHDFNNILGVMLGYNEMILDEDCIELDEIKEYSGQIEIAGGRATTLIKKLRAYSKSGSQSISELDINAVIDAQKLMLEKAVTSKVDVEYKLAPSLPKVVVDRGDLENAILNMSINAMHAMPKGGNLIISTDLLDLSQNDRIRGLLNVDTCIAIKIKDNGTGIPPSTLAKIFDPFFTTKGELGTGLGLYQVYGFMQRAKGYIEVNSELGQGTEFTMYFPVHNSTDILSSAPPVVTENKTIQRVSANVLLVEDEPQLRNIIEKKLKSVGFNVFTASNGVEARKTLATQTIDLMISDIVMPKEDGVFLANFVEEHYPHIKILLMSGFSDDLEHDLKNKSLYENRLVKPFGLTVLVERLQILANS